MNIHADREKEKERERTERGGKASQNKIRSTKRANASSVSKCDERSNRKEIMR